MSIARIIETERKTTQSGRGKAGKWTLEFDRSEAQRPDPLTGWNGSGDTNTQVRLAFGDLPSAEAYCARNGLEYSVVPAAPVALKIQAYADNFR
jgi:ETC complex I subunit conserved region